MLKKIASSPALDSRATNLSSERVEIFNKIDDSYVFRKPSECACARVWNVVFCLYFLILYLLFIQENKLDDEKHLFPSKIILFAHRKGESPVSFSGTEWRESKQPTFIFATVEDKLFPGKITRGDILRFRNGIISVGARSKFRFFFLFNQFFASLRVDL